MTYLKALEAELGYSDLIRNISLMQLESEGPILHQIIPLGMALHVYVLIRSF